MYACGKAQGAKEALAKLPITQVQPAVRRIVIQPMKHLPPGMVLAQWLAEQRPVIPSQHEHTYWPEPVDDTWLNSKPVKASLPDTTEEMPAVVKLLHERKNSNNGHH